MTFLLKPHKINIDLSYCELCIKICGLRGHKHLKVNLRQMQYAMRPSTIQLIFYRNYAHT